ncbi:Mth938-like domain-containing protein [Legionella tunisiensis]|uniref:Mth938-like domain-containing protein n=1 Tax=Legionella tunisiensis TaxID=1034944 RepID=UPI0002E28778|nr:MTH938/NDUFAF3 family protein [Legionella tunisiensis]
MHISLETVDQHTIQSYSENEIRIDAISYQSSLIVNRHELITNWPIHTVNELDAELLVPLLKHQPRIVLIGHNNQGQLVSFPIIQTLAQQGIGLECMSIGAACRTFNVLLSEHREVVLGIIL